MSLFLNVSLLSQPQPLSPDPTCRIGFATELSPSRREAWSGTNRYMLAALQDAGPEIRIVGPVWEGQTILLNRASKVLQRLTGSDPMLNRDPWVAGFKAQALGKAAALAEVDVLFAPASSALIARMPPGLPIVYASDATMRLMIDYYPAYTGLSDSAKRRAIALETEAMERADLLLYPTQWAARSAVEEYGIDPVRVVVQPFGANLEDPPTRDDVLAPRKPGPLRLLFCGVNWQRKGGDTALACVRMLRKGGLPVEMLVLGCAPPAGTDLPEGVTVIPFLDKTVPAEAARFREAFTDADVLILPTAAECYGMVFCEAAAFGAVSMATATGGVPEVIQDGVTGFVMPPGADPAAWAAEVRRLAEEPALLDRMRRAARDDFETRLNWAAWAAAVLPAVERLHTDLKRSANLYY